MTQAIPQTDSSAAVNTGHLIAIFIPGQDAPSAQSILDILSAIPDGHIITRMIADAAVDSDKLGLNAVQTDHINDGAVRTGKIQSEAVTTGKIDGEAVTTAKLADAAVTEQKLANGAVNTAELNVDLLRRIVPDPDGQDNGLVPQTLNGQWSAGGIRQAAEWADPGSVLVEGTGISVTLNGDGNYVIAATGGGGSPPVSTHQRYAAYKRRASTAAQSAFSATEYQAGASSMTAAITPSGATDASGEVFDLSFWSAQQLTSITVPQTAFGRGNILSEFTTGQLQIGSTNGYTYTIYGVGAASDINATWSLN